MPYCKLERAKPSSSTCSGQTPSWRPAAALANTRGGTLLVGVDDNGQVVGLDVAEAKLRSYSNQLADSLRSGT